MQEEIGKNPLTPEQMDVANALTAFRPATPQINRDALMYAAGEAAGRLSGRQTVLPWRIAAGLFFSATLALALWHPSHVEYVDRPVVERVSVPTRSQQHDTISFAAAESVEPESLTPVPMSANADSYLRMRERVLLLGMNALPSLPAPPSDNAAPSERVPLDTPNAGPAWQRKIISSAGDHS